MTNNLNSRIVHTKLRAHRKARAHYLAAKKYGSLNALFGVPVIIITTAVGSSIFATILQQVGNGWKIFIGLASLAAAILAALQTFFNFSKRSEQHQDSGANYSKVYRKLSVLEIKAKEKTSNFDDIVSELEICNSLLDDIEQAAPDVPDSLYDRAVEEQKNDTEGH